MYALRTAMVGLLLLSVPACAGGTDAVGNGEANLDEVAPAAAEGLRYDGQIVPRRMKFRLGAGEVQEGTTKPLLEVSASTATAAGVTSRVVTFQGLSKVGAAESLPALVLQLTGESWSPRTIACDADPALAFVVIQADRSRLETVSQPVAGGPITKRACAVTVEQAVSWDAWKQAQGPTAMAAFGSQNPGFGATRTVLRAHFEADVGPRQSADVALHVSGAFDLWDDRR